jgi:hypothetical protein
MLNTKARNGSQIKGTSLHAPRANTANGRESAHGRSATMVFDHVASSSACGSGAPTAMDAEAKLLPSGAWRQPEGLLAAKLPATSSLPHHNEKGHMNVGNTASGKSVNSKIVDIDSQVRTTLSLRTQSSGCEASTSFGRCVRGEPSASAHALDTSLDVPLPERALSELENTAKTIQNIVHTVNFHLDFYTMDTAEYINGNTNNLSKYLLTAKQYCPSVNIEDTQKSVKIMCSFCKKDNFDIIGTKYICRDCGNQREVYNTLATTKDPVRVNTTLRYTYKRRSHFKDCVNQYQGKQNTTIPQSLLETLKKYATMYGISKDDNYSSVTKEHILMFLKDSDNTKYYEDVNLIYRLLTGNKVDDISYLEDAILRDFDILSDLYDKKFKQQSSSTEKVTVLDGNSDTFDPYISRKSFINKHYILFQLLRRHGHPCKSDDFNILKTVDRKSLHEDILSKLFDELGWNFTSLF